MSSKAAPHDLAERPFYGTPRPLPRILFCCAGERFCGRTWIANTMAEYQDAVQGRQAHEALCTNMPKLIGV